MSEEVKTIRCEIAKSEQGWVINYNSQDGRTEIVAVMTKTEFGCRAALFKAGCAEPCVTMETSFGLALSWRVVRKSIKGLMSKIGKSQRLRRNKAARSAAAAVVAEKEVAA